jgi:hypothetical protein
VAVVGGLNPVDEREVRSYVRVNVRDLLVELEVVVRYAAHLVDEPELVLDTQGHCCHGVALELGHRDVEVSDLLRMNGRG